MSVKIRVSKTSSLAQELADGTVPQATQALYLLCGWLFYALAGYSTLVYSNASKTWLGLFEFLVIAVIGIFGVLYAYKMNGGGEGKQFVVRFTCLLLPVSVNVYVIMWSLYHLLAWGFKTAIPSMSFTSEQAANQFIRIVQHDLPWVITFAFVALTQLFIFLRISHHLAVISRKEKSKVPSLNCP